MAMTPRSDTPHKCAPHVIPVMVKLPFVVDRSATALRFQQPAHLEQVVLQDVSAGASLDRRRSPVRIVVIRHDENARGPVGGNDPAGGFEPAHAGHLQVHQHPVGALCAVRGHGLVAIRALLDLVAGPATTVLINSRNCGLSSAIRRVIPVFLVRDVHVVPEWCRGIAAGEHGGFYRVVTGRSAKCSG